MLTQEVSVDAAPAAPDCGLLSTLLVPVRLNLATSHHGQAKTEQQNQVVVMLRYELKYLELKFHNDCNVLSNGSEKNKIYVYVYIYIFRER